MPAKWRQSHELTLDASDIATLNLSPIDSDEWQDTDTGLTINRWTDDGYWLLWLALPLLLLGWRRGAFTAMALILLPAMPQPVAAMDWDSLWQREDQRAAELIREDPGAAATILESSEWRVPRFTEPSAMMKPPVRLRKTVALG